MQTVQASVFGVDPRNGRTLTGVTAGRVPDDMVPVVRNRIEAARRRPGGARRGSEALLPVYDDQGEVVAYERSMAPERLAALDRNTHLGEMIGAWSGRQAEEQLAQGFNELLVDRVREVWDRDRRGGRASEFVDLSDPDLEEKAYKEAWGLIPAETRDYIREKFGDDGFMVRRDMIDNAVGYPRGNGRARRGIYVESLLT